MDTMREELMAVTEELGGKIEPADDLSALGGGEHDFQQEREEGGDDPFKEGNDPVGRERDATGRFAPKVPAKDPVSADQEPGQEVKPAADDATKAIPPAPGPGQFKAPVSWKPEEREGFDKMSPHHQQAVIRREREIDATLREIAPMRKFAEGIRDTLMPYMPMIQAEGATPQQAIAEVMKTAAFLRTAPPLQKAQEIAKLVMTHGIDINMLDNALSHLTQGRP